MGAISTQGSERSLIGGGARGSSSEGTMHVRMTKARRVNGEHESIYNAIANQDPDAARAAMRTHLSNSRERLRQAQTQALA